MQDKWQSLYQAQLERYQTVFSSDHNMDAKGGIILGGILVISVFALNKNIFETDNKLIFAALIVGCAFYLISLVLLLIAFYPKSYPLPVNSTKDQPGYLSMGYEELMYQMVVDTEDAVEKIVAHLRFKSLIFSASTVLFIIGTILLLVAKLING